MPQWQMAMQMQQMQDQMWHMQKALNGKSSGKSKNAFTGKSSGDSTGGDESWKGKFFVAYQQSTKKSPTKEDLKYEVTEVTADEKKGYQAVLTVAGSEYAGEVSFGSKKDAENEAAKVAMKEMFPQVHAGMSAKSGKGGQGTKRPRGPKEEVDLESLGPKERLNHVLPFLLGHTQAKGDLIFQMDESGEGNTKYTATCLLPAIDVSFASPPSASKKAAEDAAAEATYEGMRAQFQPLLEEHKLKKAKLKQEKMVELKARSDANRAEREAKEAA